MITIKIPIFPLPVVLFPGGHLPLRIFEQRYIDMVRECTAEGHCFGVCLLESNKDSPDESTHSRLGTLAEICDFSTLDDGLLGITAVGRQCFVIQNTVVRDNGLLMAEVSLVDEPEPVEVPEKYSVLSMIAGRFMEQAGSNYPDFQPLDLQNANWVGCRLSELLPLENAERLLLLHTNNPLDRLQMLIDLLPRFQEAAEN